MPAIKVMNLSAAAAVNYRDAAMLRGANVERRQQ